MQVSKQRLSSWLVVAALAVAVGCVREPEVPSEGSAQLVVLLEQAESAASVTRIAITVSAPDMDPVSGSLSRSGSQWSGTIGPIPAGTGRTFVAEAFDAQNTRLYSGSAQNVTITAGGTALVSLTLQPVNTPPVFNNSPPRITSLVASSNRIASGGTLSLQATATDADGEALTYAWTCSSGTFSNPAAAATQWTAPTLGGSVNLRFTVSDARGASTSLDLEVLVEGGSGDGGTTGGNANVTVGLNNWPQVTAINVSPAYVAEGEPTTVTVTASDSDGDSLSYSWSSECSGYFSGGGGSDGGVDGGMDGGGMDGGDMDGGGMDGGGMGGPPSTPSATFIPQYVYYPDGGCSECRLSVLVRDGRGGEVQASTRVCVGNKPTVQFPPRITNTTQSGNSTVGGGTLTLGVSATDPRSSTLNFRWTTTNGLLSTPFSSALSSEVTWTAPSCVTSSTNSATVTATVSNNSGLSVTHSFQLTVSGPSCPATGWSSAGTLGTARSGHTAALLNTGKVLVVGGGLASAELYDPVANSWSATGSLAQGRRDHTMTVLGTGRILVVGGEAAGTPLATAELYNPSTGTWQATGSLSQARARHTALLLSSGHVMVVGGSGSGGSYLSSAEVYNPATGTWSSMGNINTARELPLAFEYGNSVYLHWGRGASGLLQNGESNFGPSWFGTYTNPRPRDRYAFTPLNNGYLLITGGRLDNAPTSDAFETNSSNLYESSFSTLTTARMEHTATRLPSGQVLVAGGQDSSSFLSSTELYDPNTRSWTAATSMSTSRARHTATRLPSGQVLVVGGANSSGDLTSAELYTP